jgi:hypothetical protein
MPLQQSFVKEFMLEFIGVEGFWRLPNPGVNSLTALCSHIIRTSLSVLAECHF